MKKRCNRSWRQKDAQAKWFFRRGFRPYQRDIKLTPLADTMMGKYLKQYFGI